MQNCKEKIPRRVLPTVPLLVALLLALLQLGSWATLGSTPEALAAEAAASAPEQKLLRGHWSEKPEIMRKSHPPLLREGMNNALRTTSRSEATIERCVTCHIVRDEKKQAVSAADPRHFCRQCHIKERVSINCFTCHASLPASDPAVMGSNVRNSKQLQERLQQWQSHQQGGVKK